MKYDSYYGIDAVDVMSGRDSSRIRNGSLIQWAYDQLALSRGAGSIVQFRKVKAHQTDNSRDSRRNRDADKLADQGRLMDLTEFSMRWDEEEMAAQLFRYPQDWDDVSESPALAPYPDNAPHMPLGLETEHHASIAVYNHPVTPMLTATQYASTHPVPPSMCFHPVPCNDNHPNFNNSSQQAPPRPGTPGGRHSAPPLQDCRTHQDAGVSAQGSPAWNKRPRSTGNATPVWPAPLAVKPRDAPSLPSANTREHATHSRQQHLNPLAQATLTHTDAASLSESGISKKLLDAATTRKSESLAATRQWFALLGSSAPGLTFAKDERGERDQDRTPQTQSQGRQRLPADVLASRNGEYMRSPHELRERDPQLPGETAEVIVGSAGEVNPQSPDVEVENRRSVVGDGRIIQDR